MILWPHFKRSFKRVGLTFIYIIIIIIPHLNSNAFGVGTSVKQCSELFRVKKSFLEFDRNLPIFTQSTEYTCGPTVLLSVLKKRGLLQKKITDLELGRRINTNPETGTSPEKMIEGLSFFGLSGSLLEFTNIDDFLRHLSRPLETSHDSSNDPSHDPPQKNKMVDYILLIQSGGEAHWVALSAIQHQGFVIMDPYQNHGNLAEISWGNLKKNWKQVSFDSQFTYTYLAIEVTER